MRRLSSYGAATEQDLPAAIDAARTRRVFQNPKHVGVIKDAIALHYARSLDTLESADRIWQQGIAAARAAYIADRPAMEELFRRKRGYWAAGQPSLRRSRMICSRRPGIYTRAVPLSGCVSWTSSMRPAGERPRPTLR